MGVEKSQKANIWRGGWNNQGGWKMTRNDLEKAIASCHNFITVTLPSSENEAAPNTATAAISVIFLIIGFTCRPKYLP